MLEWIVSSSVLITIIILLRFILKGRISLRLQYALWTLVLVRLLLPVSIGSSSMSIMNRVEDSQVYQDMVTPESGVPVTVIPNPSTGGNSVPSSSGTAVPPPVILPDSGSSVDNTENTKQAEQTAPALPNTPLVQETPPVQDNGRIDTLMVLRYAWIVGSSLLGTWFLMTNLLFAARLRKSRIPLQTPHKLPVYVCDSLDTPCLFGFLRPAVYLTSEVVSDERTMRHAVEHELTHYLHRDNLWAILRCVCLAVHWYNPLVWCAAILSRNDAELACDETTIHRLGENERAAYGRTLIGLTCEKRTSLLTTATTMTGSGKSIKERIALIAKKPKMAAYTLVAVILIAVVTVGCTFTGAKEQTNDTDSSANQIAEDGDDIDNSDDTANSGNKDNSNETAIVLAMSEEEITALPDAVIEYASEHIQDVIDCYNKLGADPYDGISYYSITEAKITNIEQIQTGAVGLADGLNLYRLEYRLLADYPENIMMAGGMVMEDGWITEHGSTGQPYLLLRYEDNGSETVWTRICVTNTDVIMVDYGTPGMLAQYGDPYLAASVELYHRYLKEISASDNTYRNAVARLTSLTTSDIEHISGAHHEPDASALVDLIKEAVANRFELPGNLTPFWSVEVVLSGGGNESLTLCTGLDFYPGGPTDLVQITYYDGSGNFCKLFTESSKLRQYIQMGSGDGVVDEDAAARYADMLNNVMEQLYPEHRSYDLVQFQNIDNFEWDGIRYEVYIWEPAFYTDDADDFELLADANNFWFDQDQRIRGAAGFFVVRSNGDEISRACFLWDLYEGADEASRTENAHITIVHYISRTIIEPVTYSRISNGFLYQPDGGVVAISGGTTIDLRLTEAQATVSRNGEQFIVDYGLAKYGYALAAQSYTDHCTVAPVVGSDRFLYLLLDGGYHYLIDAVSGEVLDPLAALDAETAIRLSSVNFSPDGKYAVISHHSGTECILLNCWTGEITKLPYDPDIYSVSGCFLDETTIILTSAFEDGEPHKVLYSLTRYDITTGELSEFPGRYTSKDRTASNFLAFCDDGTVAYTFEDGYLVLIDLMTWERTTTRFLENGVSHIFHCPDGLAGVVYENVVYILDYNGDAHAVCKAVDPIN